MKHYITYNAAKEDNEREVLDILKEHFSFSSKKIKSVKFAEDGLLLNGRQVTVRSKLTAGDELKILMDDSDKRQVKVVPVSMDLDIVFEDEYFLVINKAAGIVCHPSKGHYFDSLENGVVHYLVSKNESPLVHLAGRLDKDTSGLVVFAKNGAAEYALKKLKNSGGFAKEYIAICEGIIEEDTFEITTSMTEVRGEDGILKMQKDCAGLSARTYVTVLGRLTDMTVISAKIATGRMHQIRFHLSSIGHPLLGDKLYGSASKLIPRSALHAENIIFRHPFTGEELQLKAEISQDMKQIINS